MNICVDPDSQQIYTMDIHNWQINIENSVHPAYRSKCEVALRDLELITNFNKGYWMQLNDELDAYRRRLLPSYLLQPRLSKYITYLSQSELSSAFSNITSIKVLAKYQSKVVKLDVFLLTRADHLIALIINALSIKTDLKHVLQVQGYREYIYGDLPLINFQRVRQQLRDGQMLDLQLLKWEAAENFDYPARKQQYLYADIEVWDEIQKIPVFIWYPPYKLPRYSPIQQKAKVQKIVDNSYKLFKNKQRQLIEFIPSGTVDSQLEIRLYGIDKILNLFEADYQKLKQKRATENGYWGLNIITKNKSTQGSPQLRIPQKQSVEDQSGTIQKMSQLSMVSFGGIEFQEAKIRLKEQYELEFVPYLISVRLRVKFGDRQLGHGLELESNKVPFSFNPRFNHTFRYKQLKISQMPLASRLLFDIYIHSETGQQQIIGSTSQYLFDHENYMRQGLNSLTIWPFYQASPRFQCQNQYYGQAEPGVRDFKEFKNNKYSFLHIYFEKYIQPVRWSLRDQKFMKNQGFTESVVNVQFYTDLIKGCPNLKKYVEQKPLRTKQSGSQQKRKALSTGSILGESNINQFKSQISIIEQLFGSKSQLNRQDRLGLDYPYKDINVTPKTEDLAYLQTLLKFNPLDRINYTQHDKYILMICRKHYKTIPHALQIFLLSINWADPYQVSEAHRMINDWILLQPEQAIPLLDAKFADHEVRYYAVSRIAQMADDELTLYMLQLTQALQFERTHHSPLGEFLIERAINNPFQVGHELFWLLKSSLHLKPSYERFAAILEQLVMICGQFREHIIKEIKVNNMINQTALKIKGKHEKSARLELLFQELKSYQMEKPFTIPLDSRMSVQDFILEKCSVLDSKKLPLMLCMTTDSEKTIQVIFKNGDDLKQDLLTLQIIKIMDKIWMDSGFDFKLKPYKVISTEDQVGLIEVVQDASNISQIHYTANGKYGAFDEKAIFKFLQHHNKNEQFDISKDNFLKSCAGYCVATYILGVGDRHSGNIMVTKSGHLFHIDFGHFLGNFKSKFGFKRERARFVMTPEMAFVMGGQDSEGFKKFEELCLNAYNQVRKHGAFLIDMFLMSLSAGIPELQNSEDIRYLQDQLALQLSEQEATTKFKQQLLTALNDNWRRIDNFIHIWIRPEKKIE